MVFRQVTAILGAVNCVQTGCSGGLSLDMSVLFFQVMFEGLLS